MGATSHVEISLDPAQFPAQFVFRTTLANIRTRQNLGVF
jgi:hypothetical protein